MKRLTSLILWLAAPLTPIPFPPRKRRERGDQSLANTSYVFRRFWNVVLKLLNTPEPAQIHFIQRFPSNTLSNENCRTPFPSACVGERAGVSGAELANNNFLRTNKTHLLLWVFALLAAILVT